MSKASFSVGSSTSNVSFMKPKSQQWTDDLTAWLHRHVRWSPRQSRKDINESFLWCDVIQLTCAPENKQALMKTSLSFCFIVFSSNFLEVMTVHYSAQLSPKCSWSRLRPWKTCGLRAEQNINPDDLWVFGHDPSRFMFLKQNR